MQLYYFSNPIRSFLRIFILIFLTGCGSYQYSSIMTEDIYETIENVSPQTTQSTASTNTQSSYYQNAFSEKSNEYAAVNNENDILFTDADDYTDSNVENDSTNTNYGPWGDNKTNVTINMLGGNALYSIRGSRSNYPAWLMNYGYGYGNVFGYGVNSWGYGYDMYWARPFYQNLHNGLFFPYWNYNMGGYGYGYGGWQGYGWYGGYSYYNNFYRNNNNNVAYISGRRGSSNISNRSSFSSRASNNNYADQSSISDNMINSNLRDRTSRAEALNQTLATKPSYYNKPSSSLNTSNSKPSNWRPSNSNSNSKPRYNNSNNNSKPRYNNSNSNSKPSNNSRPSFNSSSSSRSGNSKSSTSSRGGKGGGN